ncbi:dihydrolipoyl dehydrogenase [Desulfobulbus alkaliphilus]|uniref:dihydrolipoyl dehydrogenase n=1 Tax=Desulfobulbus alkaliphilus TaxID=869814 RepID=UPI0019646F26|nr:dihydrolipoyl dehydrogenase [Desulfobulbus alkaliphilus]MBM9538273.1 dihydrolipoyl dehydrogenase [Desulfobulbus alkaliphilus]
MNTKLDVLIIGAGSAGLAALREVRKHTDRFAIINHGPYGTTCARVGCMPSKSLIEAANAYHRRHSFTEFGINGGASLSVDIPRVLRGVRALRDRFIAGPVKFTEDLGPRSITGKARLLGPDRVLVNGQELTADRIILATGSRPIVPKAWSGFGDRLITTDTLFEQERLRRRIAVIGLGAIGVEISQALARLGLEVVGYDQNTLLAGLTDETVNRTFDELLQREFPVHAGAPAELRQTTDGIEVTNGTDTVIVEQVIAALGRRPNIDDLGLETLGIELDSQGQPEVNPQTMQIDNLPVYLAGDANGRLALLHEAADEGHIAGLNAASGRTTCFKRRTPLVIVFSDPNIAVVGRSLRELTPGSFVTGAFNFRRQGRARAALRNKGLVHVYADKQSGLLLGAEMCAPAGEHLAHLLALAIDRSLTVFDLLRMPFYHPVVEEGLRSALRHLTTQLPEKSASDLSSCAAFQAEALD